MFRPIITAAVIATLPSAAFAARKTPYWASLNAGEVMMRTGPARSFPAEWLYKRRGLPVKVVKVYKDKTSEWRRIQDPDGAEGWVQANLLSDQRTAIVVGDVSSLRERPDSAAPVMWRAEPGVVAKLSKCAKGWCHVDAGGRGGFVEIAQLYGVEPTDVLP